MSKMYQMLRTDLADLAAVQAVVDANLTSYVQGTIFSIDAGVLIVVVTNDGTTAVLGTITVV